MAMTCQSHWDTTSKNRNTYVPTYRHAETGRVLQFCVSGVLKSCVTHASALTQPVNLATSPLFIRTSNSGELRKVGASITIHIAWIRQVGQVTKQANPFLPGTRQWFLDTQAGTCYNVSCGVVGFEPCAAWAREWQWQMRGCPGSRRALAPQWRRGIAPRWRRGDNLMAMTWQQHKISWQ